jgi:hypothetical protein
LREVEADFAAMTFERLRQRLSATQSVKVIIGKDVRLAKSLLSVLFGLALRLAPHLRNLFDGNCYAVLGVQIAFLVAMRACAIPGRPILLLCMCSCIALGIAKGWQWTDFILLLSCLGRYAFTLTSSGMLDRISVIETLSGSVENFARTSSNAVSADIQTCLQVSA